MAQPGPEANDSLRLRESFSVVQVHGTRPGVGAQRGRADLSCRESSEAMAWCVASKRARSPNDVDADQTEPPFAVTPVPHHLDRRNPPPGVRILSDWGEEEEI